MFNKHMKYGIDERGPYAEADMDASQLIDFLKVDLASQLKDDEDTLPAKSEAQPQDQAMGPMPGANTLPARVPFNIPDVIPDRGTGYSKALKELLGKFGNQYV